MKTQHEIENSSDLTKEIRESSFGWALKTLCTRLDNHMASGLKPLELSLQQFAIIMTLLEQDGLLQSEIGQKTTMPRYAVTRNLDKLEKLDYVKRNKQETSKRSHCIYLTSKGKSIGPELFSLIKATNNEFLSSLSGKEKNRVVAILAKLLR